MSLQALIQSFPWARYSQKLKSKILKFRNAGRFTSEDAGERGMRLAVGFDGSIDDGNAVKLFWLVDLDDGVIVDAKFQVFGQSALIGAAEAACEVLIGKNYEQAKRVGEGLIDRRLRDNPDKPAFPWETGPHINLVIGAIDDAAGKCLDIPVAASYEAPPAPEPGQAASEEFPGWKALSTEDKVKIINEVLDHEIRPYIALDAGGVEVVRLEEDQKLFIAYQGACTSCMSSVGATLSYIQQTLRSKLSADITVIPEM